MSLFLRNPVFHALDDAGRPLPGAVLTFFETGTTTPKPVYSDAELENSLGYQVTANTAGIFPAIYMDDDIEYRIQLHTAGGVLRWDVDPYVCTCVEVEEEE